MNDNHKKQVRDALKDECKARQKDMAVLEQIINYTLPYKWEFERGMKYDRDTLDPKVKYRLTVLKADGTTKWGAFSGYGLSAVYVPKGTKPTIHHVRQLLSEEATKLKRLGDTLSPDVFTKLIDTIDRHNTITAELAELNTQIDRMTPGIHDRDILGEDKPEED